MAEERYKRKLTTIFSTDAVGYSRLMGDDEAGTVKTIEHYRKIIGELIQQHRGQVLDSPGDNLLAEFGSVVDAVQCAVAVQKELTSRNAELPEHRRMQFRIGVNLGDVIQEGDRLYGDGVNIAARLEALADPGGICLSKTAFDHIESKLPLGYEFLGEQKVKNIVKPVGAYRVLMEPRVIVAQEIATEKEKPFPFGRPKLAAFAAVTLILAFIAVGFWHYKLRPTSNDTASVSETDLSLPDKPSIAVLPFNNLSDDPQQEYFSDGLTEEIISALSSVPKLFVIARNSTFTYKGKPVKVQDVSRELGVRYVLEGSVRKSGTRLRVTAQLVDALSGHHIWSQKYDSNLDDVFAVQEEITQKIIAAMQVNLTEGEQARVAAKGTNNLEAYLKYLQAREYLRRENPESNALARQLANEAIALDPQFAMAYVLLAQTHITDFWINAGKPQEQTLDAALEFAQKAISLDDTCAEAHGILGFIFVHKRQDEKALTQAQKAVALSPSSADTHYMMGKVLTFAARYAESISEYKIAIRLNPIPPNSYLWSLGLSYASEGNYEEAIRWCEKAIYQEPDSFFAHIMMTAVYQLAGREASARSEAAEVLRINPNFSLERFEKRAGHRLVEALRKAGLK